MNAMPVPMRSVRRADAAGFVLVTPGVSHELRVGLDVLGLDTIAVDSRSPARTAWGDGLELTPVAQSLRVTTVRLRSDPLTSGCKIGYVGVGLGAAAALLAAAGSDVDAVVACSPMPHLVGGALATITAPTLLVVGERDRLGHALCREALATMRCHEGIVVVPGAGALENSPEALHDGLQRAAVWLRRHLMPPTLQTVSALPSLAAFG